jgi:hypothetical protein
VLDEPEFTISTGLGLHAKTIWLFREQLARNSAAERLFARFDALLKGRASWQWVGRLSAPRLKIPTEHFEIDNPRQLLQSVARCRQCPQPRAPLLKSPVAPPLLIPQPAIRNRPLPPEI